MKNYLRRKKYNWHLTMLERINEQYHIHPSEKLARVRGYHEFCLAKLVSKDNK